jgi:antitoxin (DNA-binding transcriptional repressor) of toxin-antitoxin stability system
MDKEITQRQRRNDRCDIVRELDQSKTLVVARNGAPVGELSPLCRHRFVTADAAVATFQTAPNRDLARLRADLDRVASQGIHPRG